MRHVILTCKNHPDLRWSCKEIAFTDEHGYDGSRNIYFCGVPTGKGMCSDRSGLDCSIITPTGLVEECNCSPRELIRAPEDKLAIISIRDVDGNWIGVNNRLRPLGRSI